MTEIKNRLWMADVLAITKKTDGMGISYFSNELPIFEYCLGMDTNPFVLLGNGHHQILIIDPQAWKEVQAFALVTGTPYLSIASDQVNNFMLDYGYDHPFATFIGWNDDECLTIVHELVDLIEKVFPNQPVKRVPYA